MRHVVSHWHHPVHKDTKIAGSRNWFYLVSIDMEVTVWYVPTTPWRAALCHTRVQLQLVTASTGRHLECSSTVGLVVRLILLVVASHMSVHPQADILNAARQLVSLCVRSCWWLPAIYLYIVSVLLWVQMLSNDQRTEFSCVDDEEERSLWDTKVDSFIFRLTATISNAL